MTATALELAILVAPSDSEAEEALRRHLSPLRQQGAIRLWSSREIRPGAELMSELQQALERADLVILLLSPALISDEAVMDLVSKTAAEKILPIKLREVYLAEHRIASAQMLPRDGRPILSQDDPDNAWAAVAKEIHTHLDSWRRGLPGEQVPLIAPEWVDACRDGRLVIILGPRFAAEAQLPNREQLLEALLSLAGVTAPRTSCWRQAQILRNDQPAGWLEQQIAQRMMPATAHPTELHRALAQLLIQGSVNFVQISHDLLLLEAIKEWGEGSPQIHWVYGRADEPASIHLALSQSQRRDLKTRLSPQWHGKRKLLVGFEDIPPDDTVEDLKAICGDDPVYWLVAEAPTLKEIAAELDWQPVWLSKKGDEALWLLRLGELVRRSRRGTLAMAHEAVQQILSSGDEEFLSAQELFEEEDYQGSRNRCQHVVSRLEALGKVNPQDLAIQQRLADARLTLGMALLCLQEVEEARREAEKIEPHKLTSVRQVALASLLVQSGLPERAEQVLDAFASEAHAEPCRQLLALQQGKFPESLHPSPMVQIEAAFLWERQGHLVKAQQCASRILEEQPGRVLFLVNATGLLLQSLLRSVWEFPRAEEYLPRATWAYVASQIRDGLKRLKRRGLEPILTTHVEQMEWRFAYLMTDLEALKNEHRVSGGQTLDVPEHPWLPGWQEARQALRHGELMVALETAQAIQEQHPEKLPIQQILAEALFRLQRYQHAEPFARATFEALPGPGHRLNLVRILMAQNRRKKIAEAWALLRDAQGQEPESAAQLWHRAAAAEEMAPAEAMALWERYLALAPDDAPVWLRLAQLRFLKGQRSAAAEAAWRALEVGAGLSVEDFGRIVLFQRANQEFTSSEITERLGAIANKISRAFPEEPAAEQLRLQIFTTLDEQARRKMEPIRFDVLVKHGLVITGVGLEELKQTIENFQQQQASIGWLYRAGLWPYEALDISAAELVHRAVRGQEQSEAVLATTIPVGNGDCILSGSSILTGPLELFLLQEFGLLEVLRHELTPAGKLILLKDVYQRLLGEEADLLTQRTLSEEKQRCRERLGELRLLLETGRREKWVDFVDRSEVQLRSRNGNSIFVEPWRRALGYRQLLVENSSWLFLCADCLTAGLFGGGDFLWGWLHDVNPVPEDFIALLNPMHGTIERIVTVPSLVRRLRGGTDDKMLYLRMLHLGFMDALDVKDLLWAAKDPSLLAEMERVAWLPLEAPNDLDPTTQHDTQDTAHPGRKTGIRHLARLYTDAIVSWFCEQQEPPGSRHLTARLLSRLEAMPDRALDWALLFLCMSIVGHGRHAFDESRHRLSPESKLGNFWRFLWDWASGKQNRELLLSWSIRTAICQIDAGLPADASGEVAIAPLLLGIRKEEENTASLIFASIWSPKEGSGWIPILHKVVEAIGNAKENLLACNESVWVVRVSQTTYELPAEAVLLSLAEQRTQDPQTRDLAHLLAQLQSTHDGRAYRWLMDLASQPGDQPLRHEYVQFTLMAPWRLIREDPLRLLSFRSLGELPAQQWPKTIDALRNMLSEPSGDLPEQSLLRSMQQRLLPDGAWRPRLELLDHVCAVPGVLAQTGVAINLRHPNYPEWIQGSLERLRNHASQPTGRLVRDMFALRLAAEHKPRVQLDETAIIDLRQQLPALLSALLSETEQSLRKEMAPALGEEKEQIHVSERRLSEEEPGLLRICALVVQQLASPTQSVSPRDGVWLTYRLFNWFWAQMETLEPERRQAALKGLSTHAPAPLSTPTPDLFNPYGFSLVRLPYRLVSLLFALCQMELARPLDEQGDTTLRALSSPALEEVLLRLSDYPESMAAKELRAITLNKEPSVLGWFPGTPASVPQLSLLALLIRNREAFGRLPSEKRLTWIERLPRQADDAEAVGSPLVASILAAAADRSIDLGPEERDVLLQRAKVLLEEGLSWAPPELRSGWESAAFFALIRLYELGTAELAEPLQRLFTEQLHDPVARPLFEDYLIALSFAAEERMEPEFRRVLAQIEGRGEDPGPWVHALGTVLHWGSISGKRRTRELLVALAAESRYRQHQSLLQLFQSLGIS